MRFTTKTEYGLTCLIYMARKESLTLVSIKEIVGSEQYSETYVEKIFQSLRLANIIASHRGKQGGYSLVRSPQEINLREIIEAVEGATFDVYCQPLIRKDIVCTHFQGCGIRPVWEITKDLLDRFYGEITLEMLAGNEQNLREILNNRILPAREAI